MSAVTGVVVGHADLAAALIGAVQQIAGADTGLVPISNTDCDRGTLESKVLGAVGKGPAIVFIDMPAGSCHFAVMRNLQSMTDVRVVTGVNLAMLLEFVFNRNSPVDELAVRVAEVGAKAVVAR